MKRGLETRLEHLEATASTRPVLVIVGTDQPDCDAQIAELQASEDFARCTLQLVLTGVPRNHSGGLDYPTPKAN